MPGGARDRARAGWVWRSRFFLWIGLAGRGRGGLNPTVAPVEGAVEIEPEGKPHDHARSGRERHGYQRADQTEEIAEHKQCEDHPHRMEADLLADEARGEKGRIH